MKIRTSLAILFLSAATVADGAAPERRLMPSASAAAAAGCDRTCLIGFSDRYMTALTTGTAAALPVAANLVFTENGAPLALGDGLWKARTKLVARRDVFADPAAGQVALWAVLDVDAAPALLSVRLKIVEERITEIETVVARKASHALFAPETFAPRTVVFDQILEPAQRVPRARLIAIANGYFEGIEKHDHTLVSSAVDCNRFENGVQMTNRGGVVTPRACALAVDRLPQIRAVPERRYEVIDEERGVVLSMVVFDIPAAPDATPPREGRMLLLAELFKIGSGEIQRIETVMHNLPYGSVSGWPARRDR